MTFLAMAAKLDADPRALRANLLLIALAHREHRPGGDLTFLAMNYQEYLLRLPSALERVLRSERDGRNASKLAIEAFERSSIEAKTLLLRFEPWTNEYRVAAAGLVASRMLGVVVDGKKPHEWRVSLTVDGISAAEELASSSAFGPTWSRAGIIARTLDVTLRTMRSYIGRALPETLTMEARGAV